MQAEGQQLHGRSTPGAFLEARHEPTPSLRAESRHRPGAVLRGSAHGLTAIGCYADRQRSAAIVYSSPTGRYRGFECIQQRDPRRYTVRGSLLDEDKVISTWALELTQL